MHVLTPWQYTPSKEHSNKPINSYPANWSVEKVKKQSKKRQVIPWGSRLKTVMINKLNKLKRTETIVSARGLEPLPSGIGVKSAELAVPLAHQRVLPSRSKQYINCLKRPKTV